MRCRWLAGADPSCSLHALLCFVSHAAALQAVNQVLFERHGYRRQQAHGDPRNSLLSHVLESGLGSPAAMAVLFQEVCRRSGLDLLPVALEGGRCVGCCRKSDCGCEG